MEQNKSKELNTMEFESDTPKLIIRYEGDDGKPKQIDWIALTRKERRHLKKKLPARLYDQFEAVAADIKLKYK